MKRRRDAKGRFSPTTKRRKALRRAGRNPLTKMELRRLVQAARVAKRDVLRLGGAVGGWRNLGELEGLTRAAEIGAPGSRAAHALRSVAAAAYYPVASGHFTEKALAKVAGWKSLGEIAALGQKYSAFKKGPRLAIVRGAGSPHAETLISERGGGGFRDEIMEALKAAARKRNPLLQIVGLPLKRNPKRKSPKRKSRAGWKRARLARLLSTGKTKAARSRAARALARLTTKRRKRKPAKKRRRVALRVRTPRTKRGRLARLMAKGRTKAVRSRAARALAKLRRNPWLQIVGHGVATGAGAAIGARLANKLNPKRRRKKVAIKRDRCGRFVKRRQAHRQPNMTRKRLRRLGAKAWARALRHGTFSTDIGDTAATKGARLKVRASLPRGELGRRRRGWKDSVRRSNPPRPGQRLTKVRELSLAEARKFPGFAAALAGFKRFHKSAPKSAKLVRIEDGSKAVTRRAVFQVGEAPEITYKVPVGMKSNKAGRPGRRITWVHKFGQKPLLVHDPKSGVTSYLGGRFRVSDWYHD